MWERQTNVVKLKMYNMIQTKQLDCVHTLVRSPVILQVANKKVVSSMGIYPLVVTVTILCCQTVNVMLCKNLMLSKNN